MKKFLTFVAGAILSWSVVMNGAEKVVRYEDFGAKGDGKTCDLAALVAGSQVRQ